MQLEVQAAHGEVQSKLGAVVEGLLVGDGLDGSHAAAVADATESALVEHVCHAGCTHGAPLVKGRTSPAEGDREGRWWPHPVMGQVVAQASARGAARAARARADVLSALGLRKAALGPDELWALAELMRKHHLALAAELFGPDVLASDVLEGLAREGLLTPEELAAAGPMGMVGKLAVLGHLKAQDPKATAVERPADLDSLAAPSRPRNSVQSTRGGSGGAAPAQPGGPSGPGGPGGGAPGGGGEASPPDDLTEWQRRMAEAARRRGGALISGLGNRVADDMTTVLIASDDAMARERREKVAEAMADGAGEPESVRQTRIRVVEAIGGEDYARDLDRIVATEAHHQVNEGFMQAVGPDARVAVITSPGACRSCRRVYLEGGRPRLFSAGMLPPSSTNYRRKAADWVAVVPPLHPWCACTVIAVPEGWTVDADGLLQPEGRS